MPLTALILRSSDPTGLLIWCGIGFGSGIALFLYGFRLLQQRRLILDTPFSKIRSASLGMAEISGLATGPYTLLAPITARHCYYYRTLVWEWKQSGKNKQWCKIASECMYVPFLVDDNTGRMLVNPRGADLDLHRDFEQEFCDSLFTTAHPAPENVRTFLARHGVITNNKIKVEEFSIKPKNALFILGTITENRDFEIKPQAIRDPEPLTSFSPQGFSVTWVHESGELPLNAAPAAALASSQQELIRLSSDSATLKTSEMTQQQKVAAALVKAGITSPAAWSVAGLSADSAVTVQTVANPPTANATTSDAFDPHPPVLLMKGESNPTFLISWRSQREVARSLQWKCVLMIWGGPALALLSLYVLLNAAKVIRW